MTKKKTDAEKLQAFHRAWATVSAEHHMREARPWRFPDEWEWGDTLYEVESLSTAEVHPTPDKVGCFELVIGLDYEKLGKLLAEICDTAVDYVLANPELYGLKRISDGGASNG